MDDQAYAKGGKDDGSDRQHDDTCKILPKLLPGGEVTTVHEQWGKEDKKDHLRVDREFRHPRHAGPFSSAVTA